MSNCLPLISVIINCWNGEKYLEETLQSVFDQDYANWELIFWDNCSSDQSAKIFKKFNDPRLRYFLSDNKTGLGSARMLAASKANGEWLAFLDCDDIWLQHKLSSQVRLIEDSEIRPVFIYSRTNLLVQEGNQWRVTNQGIGGFRNVALPEGNIFNHLLFEMFTLFPSVMMNKDKFFEVGGVDAELIQAEDYDLVLRMANIGLVKVSQEVGCLYRIHSQNLTKNQKELIYIESIAILKKFNEKPEVLSAINFLYIKYFTYALIIKFDFRLAYDLFKKCNAIDFLKFIKYRLFRR